MTESCPKCGCTFDYACLCPDGNPTFPLVTTPCIRTKEVQSYTATVFIAGDLERAREACQAYCDERGECVTVESTTYVYTNGAEAGVRIGFINYARFPRTPAAIFDRAYDLARRLIIILGQTSASVVASDRTIFLTTREETA
jgi:hypothetical protein